VRLETIDVPLTDLVIAITLVQTAVPLSACAMNRTLPKSTLVWISASTLPSLVFTGGAAYMCYFLTLPPDPSDGGNGPAFFGILGVMTILPIVLMLTGLLSGLLAVGILHLAGVRFDR